VDIPRKVEKRLREHAPEAEVHFIRVAINESQIRELNLPTCPTKKTDSRWKNFGKASAELDAIEPDMLRQMAREVIERHIDARQLD
jgi:hypothetical protein